MPLDMLYQEMFDLPSGSYSVSDLGPGWMTGNHLTSLPNALGVLGEGTTTRFTLQKGGGNIVIYNEAIGKIRASVSEIHVTGLLRTHVGPVVRYNPETGDHYSLKVHSSGRVYLVKVVSGVETILKAEETSRPLDWKASLYLDGNVFRVTHNDQLLFNFKDIDSPIEDGFAGFGLYPTSVNSWARVADLKVWYRSPKYIGKTQ